MSLRPGRFEYKRLGWALLISLAFHLLCFGGYEFTRTVLPVWMQRVKFLAALAHQLEKKKPNPAPTTATEPPLMFVEVNPAVATPEPPKNAKYYSSQNSKAANADSQLDTDTPKITGQQEHVPKTEDAPRKFTPLQPSPAPQKEVAKEEQQPEKAKPKPPVGDLAMAKPELNLRPDTGAAEQTRPRTLVEAKMRQQQQQKNQIAGQKMKQEGGVRRHLQISSFDAKATSFGEYDRQFIDAVQNRWNDLLDSQQFALNRTGKVVLHFRLNYDGRISDMEIAESTVGETLAYVCQLAVTDPAPYAKWPSDMRREVGDSRNITFTFYY
jgi:outer membrane biosynthesis protein TonB